MEMQLFASQFLIFYFMLFFLNECDTVVFVAALIMRLSLVVCQEISLVQDEFYGLLGECLALRKKDSFCCLSGHSMLHIPDSCPLPVAVFIWEPGTQQLGRSLPLSGCLACPGLEAIVICYCSGRRKGEG